MRLLALDFDGVISDSAPEAYLVALRTYAELRGTPRIADLRDRAESLAPRAIRAEPAYERFVDMIPLGNRAEDYAVELGLIARDRDARDQAEFDGAFEAESRDFLAEFHERFYQTRAALRAENPRRWRELLGPYPDFLPILRRRAGDVSLAIATAKDRESVELLLSSYGIDDLFPGDRLVDKQAGRSKRAHLEALRARAGVPFEEIVFVDDKVNHLDDVASLGVRGVLAAWGYNGRREQRIAQQRGHRVCTLSDFESILFGRPVEPVEPGC
jgi:phosphoglycolate phosphatase-like HAD superfamily hydrolase